MKIFLILILIFFINIYKTVAEEPVGTTGCNRFARVFGS